MLTCDIPSISCPVSFYTGISKYSSILSPPRLVKIGGIYTYPNPRPPHPQSGQKDPLHWAHTSLKEWADPTNIESHANYESHMSLFAGFYEKMETLLVGEWIWLILGRNCILDKQQIYPYMYILFGRDNVCLLWIEKMLVLNFILKFLFFDSLVVDVGSFTYCVNLNMVQDLIAHSNTKPYTVSLFYMGQVSRASYTSLPYWSKQKFHFHRAYMHITTNKPGTEFRQTFQELMI